MNNHRIYDQDEKLILQALNSVHTPDFDIMKGIENKMRPRKRKKALLMAVVAVITLSATAFAAQQLGGFERLQNIIVEEQANTLTPIEIATTDHNQSTLYDGIRVELVAANVEGNTADVFFTLEDTTGHRLRDLNTFEIHHSIWPDGVTDFDHIRGYSRRVEIIDVDVNGVITVHAQHQFATDVEDMELIFRLVEITFDTQDEQHRPTTINLADFVNNQEYTLYQYPNPNPWGTALQVMLNAPMGDDINAFFEAMDLARTALTYEIINNGVPVLVPHQLNHPLTPYFNAADARATISNIGVIDGNLHIQLAHPERRALAEAGWSGFSRVGLFRGTQGELDALLAYRQSRVDAGEYPWLVELPALWDNTLGESTSIMFYMDRDGNMFYLNNTHSMASDGSVHVVEDPRSGTAHLVNEHIFNVDIGELDQYILVAHTFSYQVLPLGWEVRFN